MPPESAQCKAGGRIRDDPDVFSIIPSSRSTQSKDKETLYPSCLPHSQRPTRPPLPGLLRLFIDSLVFIIVCSCSCISQNQRPQKPVFERDKGNPRTLDRVCHKRLRRPDHSRTCDPLEYSRILSDHLSWAQLVCRHIRSLSAVAVPATPPRHINQVFRSSSMRITCKTNPVGTSS